MNPPDIALLLKNVLLLALNDGSSSIISMNMTPPEVAALLLLKLQLISMNDDVPNTYKTPPLLAGRHCFQQKYY